MNNEILEKIATLLRENAINYSVFLQTYQVPLLDRIDAQTIIQHQLGTSAVLGPPVPI